MVSGKVENLSLSKLVESECLSVDTDKSEKWTAEPEGKSEVKVVDSI